MIESGELGKSILSANEYDAESWNPVQSLLTKDSTTCKATL